MIRRLTILALALVLVLAGASRPAEASLILDQQFAPGDLNFYAIIGELTRAQTFTVGTAGRLARVEVLLDTSEAAAFDRQFQIIPTNASGVPVYGTAPLASFTIAVPGKTGSSVLGFYGADLTSFGLMVSPGDVLAIVDVGAQAPDNGHWWVGRFTEPPTYTGGAFYTTKYGSPGSLSTLYSLDERTTRYDVGFKTWVDDLTPDTPAIPEPATLALVGLGLAGIRLARKRQR